MGGFTYRKVGAKSSLEMSRAVTFQDREAPQFIRQQSLKELFWWRVQATGKTDGEYSYNTVQRG